MAIVSLTAAALTTGAPSFGTAGEALTAGELVYQDSSDSSKVKKADNTTDAKAEAVGIMLGATGDGEIAIYATDGQTITTSGLTAGNAYYISSTAGDIELASDLSEGDKISLVGVAASATELKLTIVATAIAQPAAIP